MKRKPSSSIPAVTWVTLQPESSARTSLKSVDEYLSEIQDDVPRPQRRLCLSPETLKALESAEMLVENAERQLSRMNFNSIITEELESEKFNGNANEEEKIYIRNVVASTLKMGFYDPASSAALAEHLKPKISARESRHPRPPSIIHRFPSIPTEVTIESPKPKLDCPVCASGDNCRAVKVASKSCPEPTAGGKVGEAEPQERLTVHRPPDVSIKAELAVRTAKIVDIQPQESASSVAPRENVATFEMRHESVPLTPEPPAEVQVQAAKARVLSVQKHKVHDEKLRHLRSPIEKHRKHRRKREKVTINDIPVGELSLTEPRILADIDTLLGRQRDIIRQLDHFDKFLASKLPGEVSTSNELEPPVKINTPLAIAIENNDNRCTNSRFRKPENLKAKRHHPVETTNSNENGSSTTEEVEIANIDYTEIFDSASSVTETKSDAGFIDHQEANLDAGAWEESRETDEGTTSQETSDVNVEVNLRLEVDEESVEEDKDGGVTEKLHGSSQKTSHLIDSIPETSPDDAGEYSNNSLRLSTVSRNVESTESKIENKISEVRGTLDSLLRSIDGSGRANNAGEKSSDEVPKSAVVTAESRYDLEQHYRDRSKSLSQVECANEVVDRNVGADDLINELSSGLSKSEKSASQSSQSNRVDKKKRSKNNDSQNDLMKQFSPLSGGTCKIPIRDDNTNRSERNLTDAKSQSVSLDDISGLLEASLEIDVVDKTGADKIRQSKILDDKSSQINDNIAVGRHNRSNVSVERSDPDENIIVGKAQSRQSSAVDEIPTTSKVIKKNDFDEMKVGDRNDQNKDLCSKGVSKAPNTHYLIDRSDHQPDKIQNKQPLILEHTLSNTRSLITLLEENGEEVRDSFQQRKLNYLKILESCSIPSSYQSKRVFTSTVLGDLEPPSSFARFEKSSQSESSTDTYSEGEVRFSSSTSHSVGEVRGKNEFSKSSSLTKTTSSGSRNPSTLLSRSAGEASEITGDSMR